MPWQRHVENFGDASETWHAYKLPQENTETDTSIRTVCSFISEKVICICFPYLLLCASIPPTTSKRQNIHIFVFVACCCDLTGDRPTYFKQKERAKYDAWVIASGRLSKLQTIKIDLTKSCPLLIFFKVTGYCKMCNMPRSSVGACPSMTPWISAHYPSPMETLWASIVRPR